MPRKKASEAGVETAPDAAPQAGAMPIGDDIRAMSFEQAMDALEAIVEAMEAGDQPLQQSLQSYERGAALVAHCRGALENARQQVKVFEEGLLRPLAPDDEAER